MTFHSFTIASCALAVVFTGLLVFDPSCIRGLSPDDSRVKWLVLLYLTLAGSAGVLVAAVLT